MPISETIANILSSAADAIWYRMHDTTNPLSTPDVLALNAKYGSLVNQIDYLSTNAIISIGTSAESSVNQLQQAQDKMNNYIKTINDIQKAINIATQVVSIGGEIITGDYGSVVSGIATLIKAVS